jgi:tRNA A37 threonylcarbamoyladenosine synthetase subunit TsaC/SUA5/YrdC
VEFPWPVVVDGSIGVRVSSSGLIAGLVRAAGTPLTATSANLSGAPDAETIDQITAVFGDGVDLYLDGGALTGPVSTVVDCRGDGVRVLRRGAIAAVEVEEELKEGRDG